MMHATEKIKEYRSTHPPGTPLTTQRPPDPVPMEFTKVKEEIRIPRFCAIWMRGAVNMVASQGYRQPMMQNCRVAATLVSMQLILGILLTALSFHLRAFCTSLKVRDVPTWAGIPLMLTGLLGVLFVTCCHREYPGNCGVFTMKAITFVFSALDVVLCLCSVAFQGTHLVTMTTYTDCVTESQSDNSLTCRCRVEVDTKDRYFPYDGIPCEQVFTLLHLLFVVTCVLGCLGAIFSFWFTVFVWGGRYEHFYAGLRAKEDAQIPVFTKS